MQCFNHITTATLVHMSIVEEVYNAFLSGKLKHPRLENWPPDFSGDNLALAMEILEARFEQFRQLNKAGTKYITPHSRNDGQKEIEVLQVDLTSAEIDKLLKERGPLSEELIRRIERIMPVFKDIYTPAFKGGSTTVRDEWIEGFNRDLFPKKEVALWEWVAESLVTFSKSEVWAFEQFAEAYRLLQNCQVMDKTETMKSANLQILTADQVEYLLSST